MSLRGAIAKFNKKVVIASDREFRGRVVGIAKQATKNTPTDTGRLKGNWQIAFGERPTSVPYRVGEIRTGDEAMAEQASLRRIEAKANSGRGQNVGYVVNNVEYAMSVEAGSPTNRPRRMLARAILKQTKIA